MMIKRKLKQLKIHWKEVSNVMAMLFAINIAKGKKEFKDVPKFLKEKVKECLIDMDLAHLAQ